MHLKDITTRANENKSSQFINLDSLRNLISDNGWNPNLLELYQHSLLNFPIDLKLESEKINELPGSFEKLFLQAVILKRNGNFKDMFDSLLVGFDQHPNYFPYFDELVVSVKATGQSSFLENIAENTKKIGEAQLAYLSGLLHSSNAEQEDALVSFLKADSLEPNNKNILLNLFQVYKSLGNYKKSGEALDKLKKLYAADIILKPKLLLAEGTLFYLSNNFKKAEELYRKALEAAIKTSDRISESKALTDLGICADNSGEIDKARKFFTNGITAAKDINDIESLAFANSELGVSYTFTNELVDAKKHYVTGYELYKKLGNSVRLALLSNNLGKLYMNFFDYKSALKYYEEGIQFAGDDKRAQALNLIGLADVYANLSNYSKALKYYREAQKISAEIKEISLNTEISTGLGALNFNLDRFYNASFYYQYALELQINSANQYLAADIYHKLGLTYFRMDSLSASEKYFKQSIELSSSSKNEYAAALSYGDLADLYLNKKDFNNAVVFLSKAKTIARKNQWDHLIAEEEILEGNINAERKYFEPARNNFQNALTIARKLNDFNLQILAYYSLGKLFHNNGFTEAAASFYKSGISIIENVSRPLFENSEVQISYFNAKRDLYDSYAHLLLEQKKYEDAFLIIDKSRSRNTMQNLLNLKLSSFTDDDKSVEQLYELDWMINSGIYSYAETDSLRKLYASLKNNLTKKYPDLKSTIAPEYNNQVTDFQKILADKENFLSIYLTENKSYLFLITKNKFQTFELAANKKEIVEFISKVSPYFDPESDTRYFFNKDLFAFNSKSAYELFTKTLKPVLAKIPLNEKLIISPSKELLAFPFELLVTNYKTNESSYDYSDKNFLVADYAISYSPSASVYAEEVKNKLSNNDKVLIVGDPAIDNQSEDFAERRGLLEESISAPRSFTLLPLKYSGEEVNMISEIIKADKVFLHKDATETNFKQNAELSKIIHLSTHSLLYKKQPLIFFSNFYDPENDGFLEASEIVQLKLNSDLVVLSSCSSGLGKLDESEGILGMTKAFFDAGTKSIVVSLWEVNDKYTSKLMTIFYQKLSEGYDKSEALRLAKVEFIKKHSPNPYFWAAFVLSGNTSKVKLESPSKFSPYVTIVLVVVLIAILYYLFIRRKKKLQIF
jgi:CHAT domain-containing protein/tetratricopeptide (TPR) repeat protein